MDKVEICKRIKETIRNLTLIDDNHIVGLGTGIVIKNTGILLTANHVVRDYSVLSKPKIIASGLGNIPRTEYKPFLYNVSLSINMPKFAKPLGIDLAILQPLQKIEDVPFIELDGDIVSEGTDVIMAGFPDEIKPPLHFDRMLNFNNPELAKNRLQIEGFFKNLMRLIMIRSGMIGSVQKADISANVNLSGFKKVISAKGAVYWIDNTSTYGASGGPVVGPSGKLIGIISEKGMTQQSMDLEIPSGSTMALSHKLITWRLEV